MYLEIAHKDYDMIIDNVSVNKLPGICDDNLVRNGNFDDGSKYWYNYGPVHYDVEALPNKYIKVSRREQHAHYGIRQDLYIEKECLQPKQRYHITGKILFYNI